MFPPCLRGRREGGPIAPRFHESLEHFLSLKIMGAILRTAFKLFIKPFIPESIGTCWADDSGLDALAVAIL